MKITRPERPAPLAPPRARFSALAIRFSIVAVALITVLVALSLRR